MPKPKTHAEYIAAAPEYARPILAKLSKVIRMACPEVEESIKWSHPHFGYKGMLAGMAAHKAHVNFGFWHGSEMADPEGLLTQMGTTGAGNMRFESAADLPSERVLASYVKEAMRFNEAAAAAPKAKAAKTAKKAAKKAPAAVDVPPALARALAQNAAAKRTFEAFPPSCRREYAEWIAEAKREETRAKRVATAIEWLAAGKRRHWKYEPK